MSIYAKAIVDAIKALKDRTGSSRQAIKGWIVANVNDLDFQSRYLNAALHRGVESGALKQVKGCAPN